jgi:Holliday junction resolvase RusA-like endonuclease
MQEYNKLSFTFNSAPKAIQSVRFRRMGNFISTYQPKANIEWKSWIKKQALLQLPKGFKVFDVAVEITKLHFIFAPLKSFSKKKLTALENGEIFYKTTKPDLTDNLCKGFIDALSGVVYRDDALIARTNNIAKFYGLHPAIELDIMIIKE